METTPPAASDNDTDVIMSEEEPVEEVIARFSPLLSLPSREQNIRALSAFLKLVRSRDVSGNLEGLITPLKGLGRISFASRDDCVVTRMVYELMDYIVQSYNAPALVRTLAKLALKVLQDSKDPPMRKAVLRWFGGVCAWDECISRMSEDLCIDILERILAVAMDDTDEVGAGGGMENPAANFPTPDTSEDETQDMMSGVEAVAYLDINNMAEQAQGDAADAQALAGTDQGLLTEKFQSFLTLIECLQYLPSQTLGPYYQNIIVAFSNAFQSPSWELSRLAINGLTKITEFSEALTLADAHYEPTTTAIINAAYSLIDFFTSKPQTEENAEVVVAGLDFLKTALILYGREIFWKFPSAKWKFQDILLHAFKPDSPTEFNYGRIVMEESLVCGALNCVRPLRDVIPTYEFKTFYHRMLPLPLSMGPMGPLDIRRRFGLIAESAQVLKADILANGTDLRKLIQIGIEHVDAGVRSDTVYAVGEILAHGGERVRPLFSFILGCLKDMAKGETEPEVMDDIVIAHAKMILFNSGGIREGDMLDVLTVMMPNTPLKVRLMDNTVLLDSIQSLCIHSKELVGIFVQQILDTVASILSTQEKFDHGGRCKKAENIFKSAKQLERFVELNYIG